MKIQSNLFQSRTNKALKKKLLAAEIEVSRLSYLIEVYKEQLNLHFKVTEAALLDRDMYKQHSLDLAKELEEYKQYMKHGE